MPRPAPERVLLIGDTERDVHGAILQGVPGVQVTSVPTVFDGIAELSAHTYTTVLAAAEPIERRPEPAVRVLRELIGAGRLVLFGHPTLEMLSRKMMKFGADDYVITPAAGGELKQVLAAPPPMRLAAAAPPADEAEAELAAIRDDSDEDDESPAAPAAAGAAARAVAALSDVPLADIVLEAMLQHPQDAAAAAVRMVNARTLAAGAEIAYRPGRGAAAPVAAEGQMVVSQPVRSGAREAGALHLLLPHDPDTSALRHALAQVAHLMGKLAGLQDRHTRLQQMAITDELTGLFNGRYFRHFLSQIIERARTQHFPVTLLLFDIDDFKHYNDQFGHGVGDEILKQTARLMKKATRQHDLVARIGGDEFAVVFWDKEGPRQPRDPKAAGATSRALQTPKQVFRRFKQMLASDEFTALGAHGKGLLGISAGLAVYPYEAQDAARLIQEADRKLMFGAKQSGKNTLYIVGNEDSPFPPEGPKA